MLTMFSFGYFGWGNHARYLVQAIDEAERQRGFNPPYFVDIRYQRSVRARDFRGNTFAKFVGEDRYLWVPTLGNKRISSKRGPRIQIAEPAAVSALLEIAAQKAKENKRVVFFCSCDFAKVGGKTNCHRCTVAKLLILYAKKTGRKLCIEEWVGGKPKHVKIHVNNLYFYDLLKNKLSAPLTKKMDWKKLVAIPYGSIATFIYGKKEIHRIIAPLERKTKRWVIPFKFLWLDPETTLMNYKAESKQLRKELGYLPITSKNA